MEEYRESKTEAVRFRCAFFLVARFARSLERGRKAARVPLRAGMFSSSFRHPTRAGEENSYLSGVPCRANRCPSPSSPPSLALSVLTRLSIHPTRRTCASPHTLGHATPYHGNTMPRAVRHTPRHTAPPRRLRRGCRVRLARGGVSSHARVYLRPRGGTCELPFLRLIFAVSLPFLSQRTFNSSCSAALCY